MSPESSRAQASNVSFSMEDFEKALEGHTYEFKKGQIVRGTAFEYSSDGVYVDIGGKSAGFVPLQEAALERVTESQLAEVLPLQEERDFLILREQDGEGQVLLSVKQLYVKQAWDELAEMQDSSKTVPIQITGVNRGGVTGEVKGLRGFIPRSHLVEKEDLESLIGQSLTVVCLDVRPDDRKLVLSQRNAVRAAAMQQLVANSLVEGTVASIKPYGVFVDLGQIAGLLHITQISGNSVRDLTTLFKVGQSLKVAILDIDEYKNRISLSTKVLEAYPGEILDKMDAVMETAEERFEKTQAEANSTNIEH